MKIFVTGISSGIGQALARRLAAGGHEVWGIARRQQPLEALARETAGKLRFSLCDATDRQQLKKTAAELRAAGFIPDVCVLNAGAHIEDVAGGIDFEKFRRSLATNVEGVMFWVAEFLPDFRQRGAGAFIAISSTSAYRPGLQSVAYPATKAALSMAFRGLRLNFPRTGVRFTTIHFGPVNTAMWQGKRSFLIPEADAAAAFIQKKIAAPAGSYYFPFLSTTLFALTRFLPDRLFVILGKIVRKYRQKSV